MDLNKKLMVADAAICEMTTVPINWAVFAVDAPSPPARNYLKLIADTSLAVTDLAITAVGHSFGWRGE